MVTLLALADSVTVCAELHEDTLAVKTALVAFAATVTVAGTVTIALLLDRFTLTPLLTAAELRVTVQESVPAPVMVVLLHVNVAGVVPVAVVPDPGAVRNATSCIIHGADGLRGELAL